MKYKFFFLVFGIFCLSNTLSSRAMEEIPKKDDKKEPTAELFSYKEIKSKLFPICQNAKENIWILTQWIDDPNFLNHLYLIAYRNLDVKILFSEGHSKENFFSIQFLKQHPIPAGFAKNLDFQVKGTWIKADDKLYYTDKPFYHHQSEKSFLQLQDANMFEKFQRIFLSSFDNASKILEEIKVSQAAKLHDWAPKEQLQALKKLPKHPKWYNVSK